MDGSRPLPSRSGAARAPAQPSASTFVTAWADFDFEDVDSDVHPARSREASKEDETYLTAWSDLVDVTISITDSDGPAVELEDEVVQRADPSA